VLDPADLAAHALTGIDPAMGLLDVSGDLPSPELQVGKGDWQAAVATGQLALAHELIGVAQAMLRLARDHATSRVQFERPIASFQALRHRLADSLVAGVSHSAFVVSAAYLLSVVGSPDWPAAGPLAASGFRDMTRLAAGDPEMYAGIARTNRAHLAEALDRFEAALARLRRHLDHDDPRLAELFEEARAVREALITAGYLAPPPRLKRGHRAS